MVRLVKPSAKYKKVFLLALKEFKQGEIGKVGGIQKSEQGFSNFVRKMRDYEKGKNLPRGYVPASNYWLIDGSKFIGRVSIRHKLTKTLLREGGHIGYAIRSTEREKGYGKLILRLALRKAQTLGITKALVTCDEDNIASKKIIESNGGIFENKHKAKSGKVKLRYWIALTKKYAKQ